MENFHLIPPFLHLNCLSNVDSLHSLNIDATKNVGSVELPATVSQLISGYEQWLVKDGKSTGTTRAYLLDLCRCFSSYGSKNNDSVKIYRSFFDQLSEMSAFYIGDMNLSYSTRIRRYQALKLFFQYGGCEFLILRPKRGKRSIPVLRSLLESRKIKDNGDSLKLSLSVKNIQGLNLTSLRNRAMALVAIVCKVKLSILIQLKTGSISISGQNVFLACLSDSIALPAVVRNAVLEYLMEREKRRFDSSFLFVNMEGNSLPLRTAQHGISKYLKDCGNSGDMLSLPKARKNYVKQVIASVNKAFFKKLAGN